MALEVCPGCTCRFAVGLLRCPQCGAVAPLFAKLAKEEPMPRITVHGGASIPDEQPNPVEVPQVEVAAEVEAVAAPEPEAAPVKRPARKKTPPRPDKG